MTELETFMTICLNTGLWMREVKTKYGWEQPITPEHAYEKSTCVTYAASCLQQGGYLPKGKYVHYDGKLTGNGLSYIKAHPEKFEILHVKATPQALGNKLKRGDICFYTVPHVQFFSGLDDNKTPKWYSLERGSGGYGKTAQLTLSGIFSYYSKRKIEYIIRIKFDNGVTLMPAKPVSPKASQKPSTATRYKLKMKMNIRQNATATANKLGTIPKGAVITQLAKSGTWIKCKYGGKTGWVNVASRYATKV